MLLGKRSLSLTSTKKRLKSFLISYCPNSMENSRKIWRFRIPSTQETSLRFTWRKTTKEANQSRTLFSTSMSMDLSTQGWPKMPICSMTRKQIRRNLLFLKFQTNRIGKLQPLPVSASFALGIQILSLKSWWLISTTMASSLRLEPVWASEYAVLVLMMKTTLPLVCWVTLLNRTRMTLSGSAQFLDWEWLMQVVQEQIFRKYSLLKL